MPVTNSDDANYIVGGGGTSNSAGVLNAYNDFEVSLEATDFTAWRKTYTSIWFTKIIIIGELCSASDQPLVLDDSWTEPDLWNTMA